MAATVVVTVLPDHQMGSKPSPYPSTTQQHPNHLQDPYQSVGFNSTESRRHSSSSSYQPPPSPIQGYADGERGGGGREGGGGAPSSSFYSSSHPPPPDLRGRLPSSSSSHHVPSSRSPSPSALSPQLTFETTEPQHYHGQTSFGYDFLPAVQPQIFSAPSAHPFAFASTSTTSSSTDQQQHPNNNNSPSHPQHPSYPASSSSSQVQQYTLSHSSQLGSSSRMSGEESDERKRRGRMSAQQEEEGFRRGEMLAERRNVMEQERGFTRSDGWEGRKEDRRGGMEEVDWNGSGAEDDDDDDERDGSGLGRRDSGTGSRGEIKTRRRTSRAQFQALETMFQKTSKPTQTDRKNLGEQLDMSPRAVQVWFQNRRAKAKKQRQKAASDGAGPPPPPPPPQPPLAFSENPYPGAPPNSRIHHSVPYDSMGRRASAGAGPSRRSQSDEDRMGSSSSHSFSPEAISPPFVPPHNNGAPLGGWETVPSLRRNGSVNVNGQMPPPSFPPLPQPQSNGQHPSSNGNGGGSQHLGRPNDPSGRRTNSTSPVYDDRSPQSNWNPGGGQFESRGPGFLQQSPRRGSGIPGAGEPRMGRRSSTTPADGGGVGPDRTVKRRDSNGALVLDPLSMGGRRGSIPQNIHPHQQHHSSSPSRQAIRPVVPSNGSSMEVPISHSFRGGGGQGNRQPGSTVAQYLSSSAAARRSSLPSMGPIPQGGPMRSPGGMYAPPIHGGGGGSRRELSPIQDDGAQYASQSFGSMGSGGVEQGMFDPSYGNSGPYGGPLPGGGRGGPAVVDPNPPRRQPHPFYGNGPIPEPSFEPQPSSQPRSRNNSYHHLHQQHQPYDEIDPLTIQPPAPPLPQLSQYAFPGPPDSALSSAPPQSNLLSRRNSGQALPQQPLFTSSPHESYAFPPAPIGTLPDQGFSFGTYQQGSGGGGEYAESDAGGTTERDEMGLGMGRNGSTGGDSDGSWANGFGGGGGGFGAGQDGTGHYPGDNGGLMPHGFHPDVRRSSAPADLLQNFSSLQVLGAANGLPPSAFPRPSPLNPAFAGVSSNGGGGTSPSRNGVQPLYAIHESSHSGSGSGQGRRGSGQGPQQMEMPEGFVQRQQHGGQQVDWAANQGLQGMDPNYPYPQSSHHQSYSSSSGGTNTTASQSRPSTGNQPQPHLASSSIQDPFHAFDPSNSTSSSQRHLSNPNLVFELEGPGYDDEAAAKAGGGFGFAYR